MIEMIRDPLTHIVRNAVDHGIEPSDERFNAGKPLTGSLRVSARRSEEHTSELQSLMRISYAVFCLKKKNQHSQDTVRENTYKPTNQATLTNTITTRTQV